MLTRINRKAQEKDSGFTLIELLVVIIIIGILSAIAIPLFLNQQKKAQDSAAKADVSTIGKEIATYFVDSTTGPAVTQTAVGGEYQIDAKKIGNASDNVILGKVNVADSTTWCVDVTNPKGDKAINGFKYSAAGGLEEGKCA